MIKHSESNKILEIDIKAIVLEYLMSKNNLIENHSIISEFSVDRNSRRADLVIAQDKRLIGFEIKSEADSLCRLSGQTEKYLDYFDKVIIVAAPKHISNIVERTPKNVAIWEVSNKGIKVVRRGRIVEVVDKKNLLKLMTVPELAKLANKSKLSLKSKNRRNLEDALQNIPVNILRKMAIHSVKERYSLTSNFFYNMLGENKVSPEFVRLLSQSNVQENSLSLTNIGSPCLWSNLSFITNHSEEMEHFNTCSSID
jgi:hypothetical protein